MKVSFRTGIVFLFGLLVLGDLVYLAFSRPLIRSMYEGRSIGVLNRVIEERANFPVENYFAWGDSTVISANVLFAGFLCLLLIASFILPRLNRRHLLFIAAYLVFPFIVLEIATRVYFVASGRNIDIYRHYSTSGGPDIMMADKLLGFRMMPNVTREVHSADFDIVYQTNSLGLREKEIEPTEKFKILFLGDSNAFGWGVPIGNRFSDLMENEIPNIYSINAGQPAYGIHQMLLWFKETGVTLKPDLVVCAFILSDIERALYGGVDAPIFWTRKRMENKETKIETGEIITRSAEQLDDLWLGVRMKLEQRMRTSYLYSFLRVRLSSVLLKGKMRARDEKMWRSRIKLSETVRAGTHNEEILSLASELFSGFKSVSQEKGIRILIVNISLKPIPGLDEIIKANGLEYLDLSGPIGNTRGVRFEIDPHLNSRGHRLIADHLKEWFVENIDTNHKYKTVAPTEGTGAHT